MSETGPLPRALGAAADRLLDATIAPGFASPGLAVRRRLPGWPQDPDPSALAGTDVAITGASSGIGAAAARQAAQLGANVHLIVRDRDKGERVAAGLPGETSVWTCDLSDLDSVARCAGEIRERGVTLRGLVHNAGVMPPRHTLAPQGAELSMAVHVLGPVLLTELLRTHLAGARVVLVTSGGMYAQRLRVDDLDYQEKPYRPTAAYARSKRAQVELLGPLQQRWSELTLAAMHPGWADTPGVTQSLPGFAKLTKPVLRDADGAGDTITWLLATSDGLPAGRLWHDRRVRATTKFGRNGAGPREQRQLRDWVYATIEPWTSRARGDGGDPAA